MSPPIEGVPRAGRLRRFAFRSSAVAMAFLATYLIVEAMRERSAKRRAQRREAEERAPAGAPAA